MTDPADLHRAALTIGARIEDKAVADALRLMSKRVDEGDRDE